FLLTPPARGGGGINNEDSARRARSNMRGAWMPPRQTYSRTSPYHCSDDVVRQRPLHPSSIFIPRGCAGSPCQTYSNSNFNKPRGITPFSTGTSYLADSRRNERMYILNRIWLRLSKNSPLGQ